MKCIRCGKEFDDYKPYINAETYGGWPKYACPHCGKLYVFSRVIRIKVEPCEYMNTDVDDWGHKVVSDEEYYKKHTKGNDNG